MVNFCLSPCILVRLTTDMMKHQENKQLRKEIILLTVPYDSTSSKVVRAGIQTGY